MKAANAIKKMVEGRILVGSYEMHYRWTPERGFEERQFGEGPWSQCSWGAIREGEGPFKLAPL